jgi:TPP-dependent pyruvate/acetoin dehydrogenase alpha subunit
LAAEIMGKKTGLVGGRGGSQHIQWRNFYSNGIQGGITPIAVGMAFTEKKLLTNNITLVFLGDGTLGQGIVYESFNIASLWKIPVLFVIENNRYAQTTPIQSALAGEIKDRLSAFGIKAWECSSTDVLQIRDVSIEAVNYVRTSIEPAGLILNTYRFSAHSKGDDFRDPVEIANYQKMDPLVIHKVRIKMDECQKADEEVTNIVKEAFSRAEKDGSADISQLFPILQ